MKQPTELTIIIVSYNTKQLTDDCLHSVIESFKDSIVTYEILIIDNNSTDGSKELIKKKYPKVHLIENSENVGFGRANNQGIEAAAGDVVLLLNSDTVIVDRAIERLYRFLIKQPPKTIVGGKLFNTDKTPQSSAGPEYSLINIFIALFLKGDHLQITRYSPDVVKEVDWVMGACIMAHRETFTNIGLFDEGIFMYMEEIDFLHRAKQKGYIVFFFPDAHFIHVGSGSSKGRETPILNVFRGLIYFYKKHYSLVHQAVLRVLLILKSILALGLFTLMNKRSDQILYWKALKLAITL